MSIVHEFEPVRAIPPRDSISLVLHSVVVASIPSRMASTLISEANNASPIPPSLKHLKRVRPSKQAEGLDLILHATDRNTEVHDELNTSCLPESIASLVRQHSLVPFEAQVPYYAPETREQWQEWGQEYWPMVWKIPEKSSTSHPPEATQEEEVYFRACMTRVLDLARDHGSSNVALIVDPSLWKASSSGPDSSAWVAEGRHMTDRHPLAHAVMEAVARASERDKKLWPMSSLEEKQQQDSSEESTSSSKRQKIEDSILSTSGSRPYMCTGYDLFIKREPCVMCAMALVHSRLNRVIFSEGDPENGALGGQIKLHSEKSLNHHYHVYQMEQKRSV